MKYYIAVNGEQKGPFKEQELIEKGVNAATLVWCEGMSNWVPAGELPELLYLFSSATPQSNNEPANATYVPMPKTWLVESILATLFCCMPFGIVAIVKAAGVSSLYSAGKYEEAQKASKSAKKWCLWSAFSCLIIAVLYVIFVAIVGIGATFFDVANF